MRHFVATAVIGCGLIGLAVGRDLVDRLSSPALSTGTAQTAHAWERWQAMSHEQRWDYVRRYQRFSRRADAARVFAQARQFASLPEAAQERLRAVHILATEVLQELPPSQRRSLRALPAQARALRLFRIVEERWPQKLARFRPLGGGN